MSEFDRHRVEQSRTLSNLDQVPGLNYAFSDRSFGNMSFRYGPRNQVQANRRRFLQAAGIKPRPSAIMMPVHSTHIWEIVKNNGSLISGTSEIADADGLVTSQKGLALALCPADCAPIIITNPDADFVALFHAGRDGTNGQIALKALDSIDVMGFHDREELIVGIGPTIRCYQQRYIRTRNPELWLPHLSVPSPDEVRITEDPNKKGYSVLESTRFLDTMYVDLVGANTDQMVRAGVPLKNIESYGSCTACDARDLRTFSHVVTAEHQGLPDEKYFPEGRFMAVVQLKR